jgi:hypothetical protein
MPLLKDIAARHLGEVIDVSSTGNRHYHLQISLHRKVLSLSLGHHLNLSQDRSSLTVIEG